MEVRRTNNIGFGKITKIKSRDPRLLNILDYIDFDIWHGLKKPTCRYRYLNFGKIDKENFYNGLLRTGKDIYNYSNPQNAKTIIISSIDDLITMPMVKRFKAAIEKQSQKINHK